MLGRDSQTVLARPGTVIIAAYKEQLDEDRQMDFKGKSKTFTRTCGFLASILPYTN
jgi:hypothetical protein